MGKTSVTLYALWERVSTHKIWLYPNGATSGTVPSITDRYKEGDIAQIPLNSGKLQKTGFVFVGWNTFTDGSGTSYPAGGAFKVGKVNLMLFAMWAKDTAPSATDGKVNFEVFYAMNSYFLDAKARTLIEAKVAAVKKKLSPSSEITIRIVGWVQPTKVSPNVQFLSTNRAQVVAKYMKDLGFKGTYILKYPGHDKDNLPSSRHATIEITFTK
jgi:outer membrane protein OmpA-like peptidoglycan-associated protein